MHILVTYDVSTESPEGKRRLRNVAQACKDFGQRVQKSVFECDLDEGQLELLRHRLLEIIKLDEDSLRFYKLRGKREEVVETHGLDGYVDYDEPLLF
jgi:CRISPR-associated protein Cas2